MSGLGLFELVIIAAGGLLCLALPIGIIAALVVGSRKREK